MTPITQTLHHGQQRISFAAVTLEEAVTAEKPGNGYRYTYEASAATPDLLLLPHRAGDVWAEGRAHIGAHSVAVSVVDPETLERVSWEDLTATAEPITLSGWYRSRVAGWVCAEWVNGRIHTRAWASDATACDRYDGITPAERAASDAQNDRDARP